LYSSSAAASASAFTDSTFASASLTAFSAASTALAAVSAFFIASSAVLDLSGAFVADSTDSESSFVVSFVDVFSDEVSSVDFASTFRFLFLFRQQNLLKLLEF